MRGSPAPVRVCYVDADRDRTDRTVDALGRVDGPVTVETAPDAEAALQRVAEFDCVVASTAAVDPTAFPRAVRESAGETPVLLVVDDDPADAVERALDAGATDVLLGAGPRRAERLATRVGLAARQVRSERELERRTDLFERAQDITDVGVWEYDVDGESLWVTEATLSVHGLDPDADLTFGRSMQYYHPDDRPTVREAFDRALETGDPFDLEVRFITVDGENRWVRTRGEPQLADGEVVRVRGTIQDVTERKRRERRLRRQNERLDEFASVVSHDIRNPLQIARGQLDIAAESGDPAAFEQVRDAHDRIEAIVEDVLTLARQGKQIGSTDPVDVGALARSAWQTVDTQDATLGAVRDVRIRADPDRLRQLLENLFRNSVEHGSTSPDSQAREDAVEDGSTSPDSQARQDPGVTVSVGPIDPIPTATRVADGSTTGFYVADDGPGIPADERESVFDTGYSTAATGTGFGLAIVQAVAEAHGWSVRVTEAAGGGARFEFTGVDVLDS